MGHWELVREDDPFHFLSYGAPVPDEPRKSVCSWAASGHGHSRGVILLGGHVGIRVRPNGS